MKREAQLFFDKLSLKEKPFGGSLLKNSNAKTQRPISTSRAMHLVLRSSQCKGKLSFLEPKNSKIIYRILKTQSQKHRVKIYKIAKAYNHIHLMVLSKTREGFIAFIRAISGLIARYLLGAQRGPARVEAVTATGEKISFWDKRPWTRILSWGKEFKGIVKYLEQNTLEALGFIPYQPRKTKFKNSS